MLARFGLTDVFELLTAVHHPDPDPLNPAPQDAPPHVRMTREKRLSSLAPLVFDSAFKDHDPLALTVLNGTSAELVSYLCILLRNAKKGVKASECVLCFGGSLVGVPEYRKMILDKLAEKGHIFKRVEYIDDAGAVGAKGLAAAARTARAL